MEAIVLAGGFGTRLRALVADVPKPMAPVAGRPFLEYVLASLAAKGVQHVVLSVGYLGDTISRHFGRRYEGLTLDYAVEVDPLGTGGAVAASLALCTQDHQLVLNGDTFVDLEVQALERHWQSHRRAIIVAREVPDVSRYGQLQVQDQRVLSFSEKGGQGPGIINAGVYVLPRNIFAQGTPPAPFSIETDFLAAYVSKHHTDAFVTRGEFIDIGVPEDYLRAQTLRLGRPLSANSTHPLN
jgi:D-glycero-alpha-D-manno-heptose 1-phosphate guanylyltransferase